MVPPIVQGEQKRKENRKVMKDAGRHLGDSWGDVPGYGRRREKLSRVLSV